MTVATGVEYRIDEYGIKPGEPASYYGSGAASFPGYNPPATASIATRSEPLTRVTFTSRAAPEGMGVLENWPGFTAEATPKLNFGAEEAEASQGASPRSSRVAKLAKKAARKLAKKSVISLVRRRRVGSVVSKPPV